MAKNDKGGKRAADHAQMVLERKALLSSRSDFYLREAYKTLRTNVTFSLADVDGCKVIAVSSSAQSEGKSITAANLALSFAQAGQRVLLIDCDLRKPKIARLLSMSAENGLVNVLMDLNKLKESIGTYEDTKLDVLFCGTIPPNPSELLGSERMKELLTLLRGQYDYIVLDTPPINVVTDAVVLRYVVDGYLFVVRANQSERGEIMHALDQLEYAQAKVLGFALNGVALDSTSYGYSKRRYRRYGYGRYKKYGYSKYGGYGKYGYGKYGGYSAYGYGKGYGYGGYGYGYGYGYETPPKQEEPQREETTAGAAK